MIQISYSIVVSYCSSLCIHLCLSKTNALCKGSAVWELLHMQMISLSCTIPCVIAVSLGCFLHLLVSFQYTQLLALPQASKNGCHQIVCQFSLQFLKKCKYKKQLDLTTCDSALCTRWQRFYCSWAHLTMCLVHKCNSSLLPTSGSGPAQTDP